MRRRRSQARRISGPLTIIVLLSAVATVLALTVFAAARPQARAAGISAEGTADAGMAAAVVVQKPPAPVPSPKRGAPDPQPLDPASAGPLPVPLHVGQLLSGTEVGRVQLPYDDQLFATTSFYEFAPTTVYTDLAAGSFTSDPDQGVIRILVLDPAPFGHNADISYPTPVASGPVTITEVSDGHVDVVSRGGETYQFDLATRAFD